MSEKRKRKPIKPRPVYRAKPSAVIIADSGWIKNPIAGENREIIEKVADGYNIRTEWRGGLWLPPAEGGNGGVLNFQK